MITIKPFKKNKKSPVYVDVAGSPQKYDFLRLKEDLELKPKEIFRIETNLQVECTEDCDECWVHGGLDSNNTLEEFPNITGTERYTNVSENEEIVIIGYNGSEEAVILPKDTDIARVFYSCMEHNERTYDATKNFKTNAVFNDNAISVYTMDGKDKVVEVIVNPDNGEHFWKVTEKENE